MCRQLRIILDDYIHTDKARAEDSTTIHNTGSCVYELCCRFDEFARSPRRIYSRIGICIVCLPMVICRSVCRAERWIVSRPVVAPGLGGALVSPEPGRGRPGCA